jgi:hypothetical protein
MTAVPAAQAQPPAFSPKVVLGLIAVCLICFAAFSVLSADAPDGRGSPSGGVGASSKAATGFAGAVALLRAQGVAVTTGRPPAGGYPEGTVVVLTPAPGSAPLTRAKVQYGNGVRILIVLPKWRTVDDRRRGRVLKAGLVDSDEIAELVEGFGAVRVLRGPGKAAPPPPGAKPEDFFAVDVDRPQALAGEGWTTLIEEPDLGAVMAASPVAGVFVLADPDMLNNHGLAHFENARAGWTAIDSLREPSAGVAFPSGGAGVGLGPLSAALKPPLLGATLCALAAAALIGLQALARFGPAAGEARAYALGADGLVDNSAALVRMARKEHLLAPAYAAMMEAAAAKAAGAERLSGDERLQRLERLARRRGAAASINDLAVAAASARNRADLLAVARRLYEWKREMTREAR